MFEGGSAATLSLKRRRLQLECGYYSRPAAATLSLRRRWLTSQGR